MRKNSGVFLPFVTLAIGVAIFVFDTATGSEITASMLYVAVVLLSVRFCTTHGTVIIAIVCMLLTVSSYLMTAKRLDLSYPALVNTGMSLLVLGVTTYLALKIEAVRDAARDLAETNQLRDALLGSVSHELRTPLTSIVGGVSVLADAPSLAQDKRLTSLAKGIRDEAMRLNADIQNMLDAARITSKGLQARQDWTEPSDVIGAAIDRVTNRYGRRIEFEGAQNLPLVHLDPVLVEQALGQIIANAVKFSAPDSKIVVTANVEDKQLVVSVGDKGVGLTAHEKSHITERFFRGERHLGKIPGSGLGLWIANTFIGASGGRLEALSAGENQGTTMQVIFPNIRDVDDTDIPPQDA
ncbi:ATP-binding protein [Microbacteriaceae bacterium K1510]|nr:ATP-binding protein [Microbacteriaceae bacterium K1510]